MICTIDRYHAAIYGIAVVLTAGACAKTASYGPPPRGGSTSDAQVSASSASGASGAGPSTGTGGASTSVSTGMTGTGGTGGSGGVGTGGGCAGVGGFATRTLTQVLGGGPWMLGQETAGMAVDAQDNVYLTDKDNVFVVAGASVNVYMTAAEAASIGGQAPGFVEFHDLDRGPDNNLYLLTDGWILQSGAAHQGTLLRTVSDIVFPNYLGVVSESLIAVVGNDGMWLAKPAGNALLYDSNTLQGGTDCATQDLALQTSGMFVYQPGCNGSPIVRGNVDGSGTDVLFQWMPGTPNALSVQNFLCSAPDPAGGFYTIIEDEVTSHSRLVHFDSCFTPTSGFHDVPLAPSLADAAAASMGPLTFRYCSIAVSPAGKIFIQTFDQLWRVDP